MKTSVEITSIRCDDCQTLLEVDDTLYCEMCHKKVEIESRVDLKKEIDSLKDTIIALEKGR